MNEEAIYKLSRIIASYLKGEASEGEIETLNAWLEVSPEHAEFLHYLSQNKFLESHRISEMLCDKEKAYRRFSKRKQQYLLRRRRLRIGLTGAAAILMFGSFLFFWDRNPESVATVASIPPGESCAVLTLVDGSKVLLGKEQPDSLLQVNGIQTDSMATFLAYSSVDLPEKEITYHQLDIPRKGEYQVILSDSTRVWLNSESRLRYPVVFRGKERRVGLEGEAYFEVRENQALPFIVMMQNTSVRVLGTSFNIRAYVDEGAFMTTLVEGKVQLNHEGEELLLSPSEQGVVDLKTNSLTKQIVDVGVYTSWKEGRFVFENQTLEEIMNTLQRWYDVKVFFESEKVKKATFIGNLERYSDFNKITEMLEMTGVAHFSIEGNNIYVSE